MSESKVIPQFDKSSSVYGTNPELNEIKENEITVRKLQILMK